MKLLTSNEIFKYILELVSQAEREVKIASAWIKGDFFKKIIDEIKNKEKKINTEVIIKASEMKDLNITDESVFKLIELVDGKIFVSNRLHAKFIVVDGKKAIVGSANFTAAGLSDIETGNIEAGSLYQEDDDKEVEKLCKYFDDIKRNYASEIKDNLIGFTLNPVKTDSFEFIAINSDIEEQSYIEVLSQDGPILGKINSIYAYDIGFFANPFSNNQSIIFAPFEDFKMIFAGDKHQDWKKVATMAYMAQKDGAVKIAVCDIIGKITDGKLERVRKPFNVGEAVYLASQDKLIKLMRMNFNKQEMKTPVPIGRMEGTDIDVYVDVDEIVSKHMFITGTTGSGKSFFTKKLLCNILKADENIKIFIFDPHGEYYEHLKNCIEEDQILYREFEDVIIPVDPEEVMELIDRAGFGKITSRNTNTGKELFSTLAKYIKPSLRITGLKEKSILDILKEVNVGDEEKEKIIDTLVCIYGESTINSQHHQLKDIQEKEGKRLYVYNLKNITDPNSRVNLAGLILQEIFNKNKEDRQKRLVVLEEAHNFAPERGYGDVSSGKDNISLVITRKIASEGRKFNLGLIAVSQRPAQISKYILSQLNTQAMFRIINSSDLEAIQKYVEYAGSDTINLLPKFNTGMCIVSGIAVPMPVIVEVS